MINHQKIKSNIKFMIIIIMIHLWYILCLILKWDDLIFIDLKTLNLNLYLELQFKIQSNWIEWKVLSEMNDKWAFYGLKMFNYNYNNNWTCYGVGVDISF